jgi:hypothetical protein
MSEYIFEYNACGMTGNLYLIHRFISMGYEHSGVRESELTLVSHPLQADVIRAAMGYAAQEKAEDLLASLQLTEDANVNPFLRVKQWLTDKDLPPGELYIETPKGKGRLFNLQVMGL